jgi:hypothetical protein
MSMSTVGTSFFFSAAITIPRGLLGAAAGRPAPVPVGRAEPIRSANGSSGTAALLAGPEAAGRAELPAVLPYFDGAAGREGAGRLPSGCICSEQPHHVQPR